MTSLAETLEKFQSFILDKNSDIVQEVAGPTDNFKHVRLDVYHDGYALRLIDILKKAFPVLNSLIGCELFEKIAHEYIKVYPSNHYSVGYFGRHLSKFLSTHYPNEPKWVEIAAFEWALEMVIEAPDAPQLSFEQMASIPPDAWGNLILKTHPSLQLLPLFSNVPALWQAIRNDETLPETVFQTKPVVWLIWRFKQQAYFSPTTSEQLTMMRSIQEGQTFSQVCETLCEFLEEEQVVPFAAETLRNWIVEGIFSEFAV